MSSTIEAIADDFKQLCSRPEKVNLIVLLLHDLTGVKKKVIKELLEHGPELHDIYSEDQPFTVNKKPDAKIKNKTKKKTTKKGKK